MPSAFTAYRVSCSRKFRSPTTWVLRAHFSLSSSSPARLPCSCSRWRGSRPRVSRRCACPRPGASSARRNPARSKRDSRVTPSPRSSSAPTWVRAPCHALPRPTLAGHSPVSPRSGRLRRRHVGCREAQEPGRNRRSGHHRSALHHRLHRAGRGALSAPWPRPRVGADSTDSRGVRLWRCLVALVRCALPGVRCSCLETYPLARNCTCMLKMNARGYPKVLLAILRVVLVL